MVQNTLPIKLKDLDSFSIPYLIENVSIDGVLHDLGSSVSLMPYCSYKKHDLAAF